MTARLHVAVLPRTCFPVDFDVTILTLDPIFQRERTNRTLPDYKPHEIQLSACHLHTPMKNVLKSENDQLVTNSTEHARASEAIA